MDYDSLQLLLFITARKRSLGQGNIFAPVCHSVHRGRGEYLGRYPPGRYTPIPWQVHSPGQIHPSMQVHPHGQVHPPAGTPWQVHPLGQVHPLAGTPPGRYTPGRYTPHCQQVHPSSRYTPGQVHPRQVHPPLPAGTPLQQVHPRAGTPPPQCMLGYGQQADGKHPTGMHSCFTVFQHTFNATRFSTSLKGRISIANLLHFTRSVKQLTLWKLYRLNVKQSSEHQIRFEKRISIDSIQRRYC